MLKSAFPSYHGLPYLFKRIQSIQRKLEDDGKSHSTRDRILANKLREILLAIEEKDHSRPSALLTETNHMGISVQEWLLNHGYPKALLATLDFYEVQNFGKPGPGNIFTRAIVLGHYKSFLYFAEHYSDALSISINIKFDGYNGVLGAIEQKGCLNNPSTVDALLICLKNLEGYNGQDVILRLHKRIMNVKTAVNDALEKCHQQLSVLNELTSGSNRQDMDMQIANQCQASKLTYIPTKRANVSLEQTIKKLKSEIERLEPRLPLLEQCHNLIKEYIEKQNINCCENEINYARILKQSRKIR